MNGLVLGCGFSLAWPLAGSRFGFACNSNTAFVAFVCANIAHTCLFCIVGALVCPANIFTLVPGTSPAKVFTVLLRLLYYAILFAVLLRLLPVDCCITGTTRCSTGCAPPHYLLATTVPFISFSSWKNLISLYGGRKFPEGESQDSTNKF